MNTLANVVVLFVAILGSSMVCAVVSRRFGLVAGWACCLSLVAAICMALFA